MRKRRYKSLRIQWRSYGGSGGVQYPTSYRRGCSSIFYSVIEYIIIQYMYQNDTLLVCKSIRIYIYS